MQCCAECRCRNPVLHAYLCFHRPQAAELLAYAHDTQHEKIIRGIAIGLAITAYGREEGAEGLIEQMSRDADPILRYGAMYVIGLAYRGTGNNGAIQVGPGHAAALPAARCCCNDACPHVVFASTACNCQR